MQLLHALNQPYCSLGVSTVHEFFNIVSEFSITCLYAKTFYDKIAARFSRDFLTNQNIVLLPWRARSPDLVPIEHVWDISGRNVRSRYNVRTRPQIIAAS